MLKVANIIRDQHFMDGQIHYTDLTNDVCCHDYFIIQWNKDIEFKRMKLVNRVKIVNPDELINVLHNEHYDALFIHNLLYMPMHYMHKIPKALKVFWFVWGYDIYNTPHNNPYVKLALLHPKSQKAIRKVYAQRRPSVYKQVKWGIKRFLKNIFDYKHQDHNDERRVYVKAVERIDYFAGVFPLEYSLLVGKPGFRAKEVEFELANPVDWTPCPDELPTIGENILIGNSADINNNHLDLIDYLKNLDLKGRKLIIPLSYGGSMEYASMVKSAYKDAFGESAMILMDYMPREEYYNLLSTAGYAVFFHERQQASCNVEELLRHGVKVFFSKTSLNYRHYTETGYNVYTVQDNLRPEELTPLEDYQKWENLHLWYSTNNRDYRLKVLHNLYDIIRN